MARQSIADVVVCMLSGVHRFQLIEVAKCAGQVIVRSDGVPSSKNDCMFPLPRQRHTKGLSTVAQSIRDFMVVIDIRVCQSGSSLGFP